MEQTSGPAKPGIAKRIVFNNREQAESTGFAANQLQGTSKTVAALESEILELKRKLGSRAALDSAKGES